MKVKFQITGRFKGLWKVYVQAQLMLSCTEVLKDLAVKNINLLL